MTSQNRAVVSLIIPAYNVEKYVERCLKSVERQTYGISNLEVILVDDASTDHTLELLKQFEAKYPENVILIPCEENGKLGAARNIGMEYVSGKYLMYLDSDDAIDETMIEKMVDIAEQYDCEEVECGYKSFVSDDEMFIEKDIETPYYLNLESKENRKKFICNSLKTAVWGRLYRRDFLEENGLRFLEQIFYEDVHFSGIAMFLLRSYYRMDETLYYYFQNAEGIIHSAYRAEKVRQEATVMDILLADLDERGMLDTILEDYHAELEAYCFAKSWIDPICMMTQAQVPFEVMREEIRFFKEHLLQYFPDAANNLYLKNQNGIAVLGNWLLSTDKSRTEELFDKRGKKNIFLMNTHEYINIGDHLITEATMALLSDYYPDYRILEVTVNHFMLERWLIKSCVQKGDIIVIVGGGFLGSLWMEGGEYNVRAMVEDYPENRILIFPQSMYYGNDKNSAWELMQARGVYAKHPNLHMVLREERSYVFAKNVMPPNVKTYLLPDAALYLDFAPENIEREQMAVCLRKDKEQVCGRNLVIEHALTIAAKEGMEAVETDMLMPEAFPNSYRSQVVGIKAEEFAGYRVVITDRLHCMVYCAITKTPCVALDNLSKKVSGVYRWIENLPYIKVIEKIADLDEAIASVLRADTNAMPPHALLATEFETLAGLVAPADMPQNIAEVSRTMQDGKHSYVKYIDVNVGNENCNLRCEYCYIAQKQGYHNKFFSIPYDLDFLRRAFSVNRFGGRCLINICSSGETFLSMELIPIIRMFLEEGHYVMAVTNGTVKNAFEALCAFPQELRDRLFIKFSFHYLELKRLSLFEAFWENVSKMKEAGISYTLEITPCDNLIPHIADIKEMFDKRANGAMPHLTIARDDRTGGIDILSELSKEDYIRTWGVFDSELFAFKMSVYHRKITEHCLAGEKSFSLTLQTGEVHKCVAHERVGNLYADIADKVKWDAIGCHCRLPYCFNGHLYLTVGLCEGMDTPTYLSLRDRTDKDGNHWVVGDMREVFTQKFTH